jgi:hypothetical protein
MALVIGGVQITDDERAEWLDAHAKSLPAHMAARFLSEAADRPDELPTISRDVNEVYPAPESTVRSYEGGILHWQWADGSGFPPPRKE